MDLKEYRKQIGITIKEASKISKTPLRTYIRYENDNNYGNELKRKQIILALQEKYEVNEEKGLLSIDFIKNNVSKVLDNYKQTVSFCYLFGSYAKGYAKEDSDVDLLISTSLSGFEFIGLIEEIREVLQKKIDLLRLNDLKDNMELVGEVMKEGIKIYG